MRTITHIAVHCTGTLPNATVESILKYWKNVKRWEYPGYHFIVKPSGEIVQLLDIQKVSNGVEGRNRTLINIAYIGGLNSLGKAADTRTPEQKNSILAKLRELKVQFQNAIIQGHRDFPGVKKACPCFNAKEEYKHI